MTVAHHIHPDCVYQYSPSAAHARGFVKDFVICFVNCKRLMNKFWKSKMPYCLFNGRCGSKFQIEIYARSFEEAREQRQYIINVQIAYRSYSSLIVILCFHTIIPYITVVSSTYYNHYTTSIGPSILFEDCTISCKYS